MSTDARKRGNTLRYVSIAALALGIALVTYMITVEGEPGLLPLALILAGGVGWLLSRRAGRQP